MPEKTVPFVVPRQNVNFSILYCTLESKNEVIHTLSIFTFFFFLSLLHGHQDSIILH